MPDTRRILVVKLSALGDLFHAVPVVHRLKQELGGVIDWVTQPEYAGLAACHRDVDRVLAFPRKGSVADLVRFRKALRTRRYDLAVDLQGLTKSGMVLGMARAGRKLAPSRPRELAGWFATETPAFRAETPHAMDRLFDTLRHLDIDPEPVVYPLDFPEIEPLPGTGPRLAIAPRSRWPGKDWPAEKFVELVETLREERKVDVFILGGPGDRELGESMAARMGTDTWNLCGGHSLTELGAVLKQIDCLVCNDSGPMHYAAAVGTPLVALFGPTDPAQTGPWGRGHLVLRPPEPPGGYPDHRSYKHMDHGLIAGISVADVADAVRAQLSRNQQEA